MIIHSLFGSFCIVANARKSDGLLMRSKSRLALNRIFDDRRISNSESTDYPYCVELCKQEFVNLVVTLTKDITYDNFDNEISDLEVISSKISI